MRNRFSLLYPLFLIVFYVLFCTAVAVAASNEEPPATMKQAERPEDCPVGQYLCLTPGHGGFVLCQDGVLDIQPDPDNPSLHIVYCDPLFASERGEVEVYFPAIERP